MKKNGWGDKLDYLLKSRFLYHNDDYLEFLVSKVWKLDKACRIVDFGCGFGFMGLKLLPLLPEGSSYTGIDTSPQLLKKAKEIFGESSYDADFLQSDVHNVPIEDNLYDLALCHALLMHSERPENIISEMLRVTKPGGMVIACEANRIAHAALVYVDEFEEHPCFDLGFSQRYYGWYRKEKDLDYNIGIKMPVLFRKAGLENIESRLCDRVNCLFPTMNAENHEKMYQAVSEEGLGTRIDDERAKEIRDEYVQCGISEEEAERVITKLRGLKDDFIENGRNYDMVWPGLLVFTSGKVAKTEG